MRLQIQLRFPRDDRRVAGLAGGQQETDHQHDSGNDNATTMHRRQRLHDAKIIRRVPDFRQGWF